LLTQAQRRQKSTARRLQSKKQSSRNFDRNNAFAPIVQPTVNPISVAYDNECAGGAAFTHTFTGQIVITNRGSKFLNSGDSGAFIPRRHDGRELMACLPLAGQT
jgi:hypothetical protein